MVNCSYFTLVIGVKNPFIAGRGPTLNQNQKSRVSRVFVFSFLFKGGVGGRWEAKLDIQLENSWKVFILYTHVVVLPVMGNSECSKRRRFLTVCNPREVRKWIWIRETMIYTSIYQVLPSDLFGWFKWPFQGLSDLHLGDQKVTWKKLVLRGSSHLVSG